MTHWGTSWDYVLTSIRCETYAEEEERKARTEAMTEEERAEQEAKDLEDLLNLWEKEHEEDINNAVVEAVTEEIPVYFTDDEEPNELTPTLRDASGQPYTVGYTVRATENRFGIPVGFVGKVTDIFAESDGLIWAEVTNDNGSAYRGLADDWQSFGDSVNEGGDK